MVVKVSSTLINYVQIRTCETNSSKIVLDMRTFVQIKDKYRLIFSSRGLLKKVMRAVKKNKTCTRLIIVQLNW